MSEKTVADRMLDAHKAAEELLKNVVIPRPVKNTFFIITDDKTNLEIVSQLVSSKKCALAMRIVPFQEFVAYIMLCHGTVHDVSTLRLKVISASELPSGVEPDCRYSSRMTDEVRKLLGPK